MSLQRYSGVKLDNRSFSERRTRALASAKRGISISYSSEEHTLMHAIDAYLETSRSFNLAYERLGEWYGIYFPELKPGSPQELARLAVLASKGAPTEQDITAIINDRQRSMQIKQKMDSTMGRKMIEEEKGALESFANLLLSIAGAMEQLEAYINGASKRLLPNVAYLTDEKIAAELLSKAGSIEKLATMPASTIQLLGAEKALFKHIKFGSKPPKYGILFKLPDVTNAPRDKKGKIARAYAAKIAIAVKADFYTKKFIAEMLKKSLAHSLEKIRTSPTAPKKFQKRGGFR